LVSNKIVKKLNKRNKKLTKDIEDKKKKNQEILTEYNKIKSLYNNTLNQMK